MSDWRSALLCRLLLQVLDCLKSVNLGIAERDLRCKSEDLFSLLAMLGTLVEVEHVHGS